MSHHQPHHRQDVTLQLPGGEQYRLAVSDQELAAWLAPGSRAPHEPGGIAISVEVRHAGGHAVIPMGASELKHWLSRARRAVEAEQPIVPQPVHDPVSGRGMHDPATHRPGPNVDKPPDPTHHGARRRRRQP